MEGERREGKEREGNIENIVNHISNSTCHNFRSLNLGTKLYEKSSCPLCIKEGGGKGCKTEGKSTLVI